MIVVRYEENPFCNHLKFTILFNSFKYEENISKYYNDSNFNLGNIIYYSIEYLAGNNISKCCNPCLF